MKTNKSMWNWGFRWVIFILFFYGAGLVLGFYFGLGWFLLFQTLYRILFAIPKTYLPIIQFLSGTKFMEEKKAEIKGDWFSSPSLARSAFIFLFVTIIAFWKVNIPLYKIVEAIIH